MAEDKKKSNQAQRSGQEGLGKKYRQAQKKVDQDSYELEEAVEKVKETAYASFDETVEAHLKVKSAGLTVQVEFPFSRGKEKKIAIADNAEIIEKIAAGEIDFDVLLASQEAMPKLMPHARVLGPQGLMPNPKDGTLVSNPQEAAEEMRQGKVTLRTERKNPLIHAYIGKVSQDKEELVENARVLIEAVGRHNISRLTLCATMGPAVPVRLT